MIPSPKEFKEVVLTNIARQEEEKLKKAEEELVRQELETVEKYLRRGSLLVTLVIAPSHYLFKRIKDEIEQTGWILEFTCEGYQGASHYRIKEKT